MIGIQTDYPAVVPYLTCGWPTAEGFLESVDGLGQAGCPFFEVGFPFSDPIADGPTIQLSSSEALAAGMSLDRCFELTGQATQRSGKPAIAMTYANIVFHNGLENFCRRLKEAGAVGLIVPDLSFEESAPVAQACAVEGLQLISFVAPTSTPERRQQIAAQAQGFLYLVAVRGVTGGVTQMNDELGALISDAKSAAQVPVLVGFGVRGPEQVRDLVAGGADGVIVGSALIELVRKAHESGACLKAAVRDFLRPLVEAAQKARAC